MCCWKLHVNASCYCALILLHSGLRIRIIIFRFNLDNKKQFRDVLDKKVPRFTLIIEEAHNVYILDLKKYQSISPTFFPRMFSSLRKKSFDISLRASGHKNSPVKPHWWNYSRVGSTLKPQHNRGTLYYSSRRKIYTPTKTTSVLALPWRPWSLPRMRRVTENPGGRREAFQTVGCSSRLPNRTRCEQRAGPASCRRREGGEEEEGRRVITGYNTDAPPSSTSSLHGTQKALDGGCFYLWCRMGIDSHLSCSDCAFGSPTHGVTHQLTIAQKQSFSSDCFRIVRSLCDVFFLL